MKVTLTVNRQPVSVDIEERTLLSDLIRDVLGLTGTHRGCDTAQCGACTVHLDGNAVKSCNVLAAQAQGREVTTIEGVQGSDGGLHPVQQAFRACHALQCGFCTPGMVMSAIDMLRRIPNASTSQIREELEGNLCRCTGYENIVTAIAQVASQSGE